MGSEMCIRDRLIAPRGVSRKTVRASDPTVRRVIHVEPFSIHCQSCHAGLKVTKASLLGKRLPCPKCRAIVVVPKKPRPVIQDESIATSPPDDGVTSGESPRGFEVLMTYCHSFPPLLLNRPSLVKNHGETSNWSQQILRLRNRSSPNFHGTIRLLRKRDEFWRWLPLQ